MLSGVSSKQCSDALTQSSGALRLLGYSVLVNLFAIEVTWLVVATAWATR